MFISLKVEIQKIVRDTDNDFNILHFSVTGNPVLFDWEGLKFQGFIYDNDKGRQMALAVVMENIRIAKIVERIMKKPFDKIGFLSEARCCKHNFQFQFLLREIFNCYVL